MGLGLTKASAARKPGLLLRFVGVEEGTGEIEGVERVDLRLVGLTEDLGSEDKDSENDGEERSREALEAEANFEGVRSLLG